MKSMSAKPNQIIIIVGLLHELQASQSAMTTSREAIRDALVDAYGTDGPGLAALRKASKASKVSETDLKALESIGYRGELNRLARAKALEQGKKLNAPMSPAFRKAAIEAMAGFSGKEKRAAWSRCFNRLFTEQA